LLAGEVPFTTSTKLEVNVFCFPSHSLRVGNLCVLAIFTVGLIVASPLILRPVPALTLVTEPLPVALITLFSSIEIFVPAVSLACLFVSTSVTLPVKAFQPETYPLPVPSGSAVTYPSSFEERIAPTCVVLNLLTEPYPSSIKLPTYCKCG